MIFFYGKEQVRAKEFQGSLFGYLIFRRTPLFYRSSLKSVMFFRFQTPFLSARDRVPM